MPLETPRYSTEKNCEVYHNHSNCTEANNIEKRYFAWGTGYKRLCKHCERLGHEDGLAQDMVEKMRTINPMRGLTGGILNPLYASMMSKKAN